MMRSIVRFFSSIKLAISLFITITLASIFGTLIPQHQEPAVYQKLYGNASTIISALDLGRLFQSPLYIGLLLIFSVNLIVCGLSRLRSKAEWLLGRRWALEKKEPLGSVFRETFLTRDDPANSGQIAVRELKHLRYRASGKKENGRHFIRGRKQILGSLGADIVHLGILIVLAGGIMSGLGKHQADFALIEGQTAAVPFKSIGIRLDKFETDYYKGGAIRGWKSTVTVLESGLPKLTKTVEVNHPLAYKGVLIYQSGFGADWDNSSLELLITKKGAARLQEKISLSLGQKAILQDGTEVSAMRFLPDFVLNGKNQAVTLSNEPNNPAALIQGRWKDGESFQGWVFAKFPEFTFFRPAGDQDLSIELKGFKAPQFSVLQASRDPGAPLIWIGCSFLLAGLMLSFYRIPREVTIVIENLGDHEIRATVAAQGTKSRERLEKDVSQIMSVLKKER